MPCGPVSTVDAWGANELRPEDVDLDGGAQVRQAARRADAAGWSRRVVDGMAGSGPYSGDCDSGGYPAPRVGVA